MTGSASQSSAPKRGRSRRRLARELAMKGVYQWLITGHETQAIEAHLSEDPLFAHADHLLFLELLRSAIAQAPRWREALAPFSRRPIAELSPIEHAILLLAAVEFANHPETNHRVILDEAIELAKQFGADEGFKFVNGVLDRYARAVRSAEFTS